MHGIILAGGYGTRLAPLNKVTNKHLLPVYNKPMIYYPLKTLINIGIKEILIISGPEHVGHFMGLLGSGKDWGVQLTYKVQDEAGGIAQALGLAENFAKGNSITVILGDNIFEESLPITDFQAGAKVFLKQVPDPHRFGVAEIQGENIISIEEKPKYPKTNYAVTGLYIYDNEVFDIVKTLKPSHRGELEITDVNNAYIQKGKMKFHIVKGFWSDAGTFPSLMRSSRFIEAKESG